jgi:hypothetical protein
MSYFAHEIVLAITSCVAQREDSERRQEADV